MNWQAILIHIRHHGRPRAHSQRSIPKPTKPMITEAASAGRQEAPGFAPVPRLQIVTIERAPALRDRAVRPSLSRDA